MSEAAEEKIAGLERELTGLQEMLAFVIQAAGGTVVVTNEDMTRGLPEGTQINIDNDVAKDAFVFSLSRVGEDE